MTEGGKVKRSFPGKTRVFRRFSTLGIVVLAAFLSCFLASSSAVADLSKLRLKTGGKAEAARVHEPDAGKSDGALETSELARDAKNWFDPEKANYLREFVLDAAKERRGRWIKYPEINLEKTTKENIRKISGTHVDFYTDLPSSREVDQIPEALDAAVPLMCEYFHVDAKLFQNWKIEAFLMRDVDAFIRADVLNGPPKFLYGYSDRDRIFAKDQKVGYYNRFLLIHELVHAFMHEHFGDLRPRWYSEGIAEHIALHRYDAKTGLRLAQIPEAEDAYPGFGRLAQIKQILKTGRAPAIIDILEFEPRDFEQVATYAWSWAFVMFLSNSPKYKEVAEVLPYWMVANDPNRLFADAIGKRWEELEYDWADFLDQLDYGYDFERTSIDYGRARAATSSDFKSGNEVVAELDPSRGWQSSGIKLEEGKKYRLTVDGRFDFYLETARRIFSIEGVGASIEYYNGVPVGRVKAVVVAEPREASFAEVYHMDASDASRRSRGARFVGDTGSEASGFSDSELAELQARETSNRSSLKKTQNRRDEFYNALWPWNRAIDFAATSTRAEPEFDGTLYLRVNSSPRNLERNSGRIKVRIKEIK